MAESATRPKATRRLVVTPNPGLAILTTGKSPKKPKISLEDSAYGVLAKVAKAMKHTGTDRKRVFTRKTVYAYSIYPQDLNKLVREDKAGKRTIGRLVGGRFRPTKTNA